MTERVRITDVSPRDGLQNEPGVIPTADKVRLVELLCATGVDEVEVTSFVSPKWVPQLGDAAEVLRQLMPTLLNNWPSTWPILSALVPNLHGAESLRRVERDLRDTLMSHPNFARFAELKPLYTVFGIEKIAVFTAASETFCRRNINATIAESIERFRPVVESSSYLGPVRGYVSCAYACPFEGPIHPQKVAAVVKSLVEIGVREVDLGDTIGAGAVDTTAHLFETIHDILDRSWFAEGRVTLHLHDTFGRAAECVKAALDVGVRSFDGSVAGLGGCPYASTPGKRAPGNISTELLVRTVEGAGYKTGVDLEKLEQAAKFAREIVGKARAGS